MTDTQEENMNETKDYFSKLITQLGLEAELQARNERNTIYLHVKTNDPGRIIGRKGQTLNALQHLLNSILLNQKKTFPKVLIDVQGPEEHKRRELAVRKNDNKSEKLGLQILDAVKEVKRWGEEVTLPRMSLKEFQFVQSTLKDDSEVEVSCHDEQGSDAKKVVEVIKQINDNADVA